MAKLAERMLMTSEDASSNTVYAMNLFTFSHPTVETTKKEKEAGNGKFKKRNTKFREIKIKSFFTLSSRGLEYNSK